MTPEAIRLYRTWVAQARKKSDGNGIPKPQRAKRQRPRKVRCVKQPKAKAKAVKLLKGLPSKCYKGHPYTAETTGTKTVGGKVMRKCLTCEAERRSKIVHGTFYAYRYWRCRCPLCRQANTEKRRQQRLKGKA